MTGKEILNELLKLNEEDLDKDVKILDGEYSKSYFTHSIEVREKEIIID